LKALRIGYQKTGVLLVVKARAQLERRFESQGLAVRWVEFPSGPPLLEALNADGVDYGYTGDTPPIFALLGIGVTVTLAVDGFDLSVDRRLHPDDGELRDGGARVRRRRDCRRRARDRRGDRPRQWLAHRRPENPDLLATLGMMFLLAGLQLIPSAGRSITIGLILSDGSVAHGAFDPVFQAIGRHELWGVAPLPVVIVAIMAAVAWFFMERTR
jgi:hypothetical protein